MRVLISIGCDKYEYISPLFGAERDAKRIFEQLTRADVGAYCVESSKLLLSPSSSEVRSALADILVQDANIEELTFFFAGHGCLGPGSFYMCVSDSRENALSMTATSLGELLRFITEANCPHTNIVIDACESSGLVEDLGTILKINILGKTKTPGLTLVAASASDEYAIETPEGGMATNAILDCISGEIFIRDDSPTLELSEIGRAISPLLGKSGQSPTTWGLNLHATSRFCANPAYSKQEVDLRQVLMTSPRKDRVNSELDDWSASELWKLYYSTPDLWTRKNYVTTVHSALSKFDPAAANFRDIALRINSSLLARASVSSDLFLPIEITAGTLTVLTRGIHSKESEPDLKYLCSSLILAARKVLLEIEELLETDDFLLLRAGSGLADLFYLPLRVLEVCGWLSLALHDESDFSFCSRHGPHYHEVVRSLLDKCTGGFTAMSEEQSPFLASTISALESLGFHDTSEEVLGYLFSSAIEHRGRFANPHITGSEAFSFLRARAEATISEKPGMYANPSELLTLILRLGYKLSLDDVFDTDLWLLDHASCLEFRSHDVPSFSAATMRTGTNKVLDIGRNVFRVSDIDRITAEGQPEHSGIERLCAISASLVYADRIYWPLIDGIERQLSA